ncbi:MAG: glycoside hydrolase family 1 protein [Candidatus Sungiibacteriota bacterium]|uniref:Glycoside hydrolase family 1 protein n=1 Tax=Candidatus Sungiibacteriota bacterium TaxID=2750080 RepID=A0A7T5UPP6_9BACT|nr:MAG: glycoside hydrolase family 1 protein [Candidatus Sungbacteria bacterium]
MRFEFPKGFLWGAATSAHQVEGNNHNDWTEWEHANSARLAAKAARRHSNAPTRIPDYILKNYPNPLQEENYISGRACDHYNRFREDFDIAKSLGHNAHRFSIEWSRIEPEEGKFDEKEIKHYSEVLRALRERGMEPFVTLWHWTNPVWFAKRGGWVRGDAPSFFARYCLKVAESFPEVKYWITLNEPEAFPRHGYLLKDRPPALGDIVSLLRSLRNLAKAHKEAYQIMKEFKSTLFIGYSESSVYFEPFNRMPHNVLALQFLRWWKNNPFFKRMSEYSDFIGLQFYFHTRVRLHPKSQWGIQFNENKRVTDMGWEIFPEGIYHVLMDLQKYKKPIFITENGLADARDLYRGDFIQEHIAWTAKAIRDGADVRGYFHWSLLDNFEWQEGFWPRFGLVEVDFSARGGSASGGKTLERKIRPSAWEYKKIIEKNALEI